MPDVVVRRDIAAPPEIVFAMFADPALLVRWLGDTAELDPVPGGVFRFTLADQDACRGHFVELDPRNHVLLESEPAWSRFQEAVLDFTGQAQPDNSAAFSELSPRERETLSLLAEGLSNSEIAERLGISRHSDHELFAASEVGCPAGPPVEVGDLAHDRDGSSRC